MRVEKLSKNYKKKVLDNVTIDFTNQTINLLIGRSGTGKTTLLNLLFGLDQDYIGKILIDEQDISKFNNQELSEMRLNKVQYVFQDFKLHNNLTVYETLYYSLANVENVDRVEYLLESFELSILIKNKVSELSGGQKQRLAFARAIINKPEIILMDEPTSNLDDETTEIVLTQIKKLKELGHTVVISSHDKRLNNSVDNIYEIKGKQINKITENINDKLVELKQEQLKKKRKLFKYTLAKLKMNKSFLISINVVMVAIIIFIMLLVACIVFYKNNAQDIFYRGISDQTILLNIDNSYQEPYEGYVSGNPVSSKKLGFGPEDIEKIEKIDHVEQATLFDKSLSSGPMGDLIYTIDKDMISQEIQKQKSYPSAPEVITFSFEGLKGPKEIQEYYQPEGLKVVAGEFPENDSNQILIPDILALQEFPEKEYEQIIGETIMLPLLQYEDNKVMDNNFIVSGIYETGYKNYISPEYLLYSASKSPTEPTVQELELAFKEQSDRYYNSDQLSQEYYESAFVDQNSFNQSIGWKQEDILIVVDDKKNIDEVEQEINILYPNYKLITQNGLEDDYSNAYLVIRISIIIGFIFIGFILYILTYFLNRSYMHIKQKELAIDYSLGYSSNEIKKTILYEYLIINTINFIISYIMILILNYIYFSHTILYPIFDVIFSFQFILIAYGVIIIFTFGSLLTLLFKIKSKKLIKYLM